MKIGKLDGVGNFNGLYIKAVRYTKKTEIVDIGFSRKKKSTNRYGFGFFHAYPRYTNILE